MNKVLILLLLCVSITIAQYATITENYGNYCGLNNHNNNLRPIDEIDECCMIHDRCTHMFGLRNNECHISLRRCLHDIHQSSRYYINNYHMRIINTVDRMYGCYTNKVNSGVGTVLGGLLMFTPLAPLGAVIGGGSILSMDNSCYEDLRFILSYKYNYFMN